MTAHEASSDLREPVQAILAAHRGQWEADGDYGERVWFECKCGWVAESDEAAGWVPEHEAHVTDAVLALVSPLLAAKDAEIEQQTGIAVDAHEAWGRERKRAERAEAALEQVRALRQNGTFTLAGFHQVVYADDLDRALAGDAAPEPTPQIASSWQPMRDPYAAPEQDTTYPDAAPEPPPCGHQDGGDRG